MTMTPSQVRRRFKAIQKHQDKWDIAEKELQDNCPHVNADENYKGKYCPDCGKFWTEEQ